MKTKKLNLGSGDKPLDDYENLDGKHGDELFPLAVDTDSVNEIRASHVLEHFPHGLTQQILNDWARALEPGGTLKIAVPDFSMIAQMHLEGKPIPVQGFVMGGQTDDRDYHKAVFEERSLAFMMRSAGLVCIRKWKSTIEDCAALPISLNLQGTKPCPLPKVAAVMTIPRLGFNDFWGCAYNELSPLGIPLRKTTGAYWDRGIAMGIDEVIKESDPEWVLTFDYDTIFTRQHVADLLNIVSRYPHVDALAPLQVGRHHGKPMFTVRGQNGELIQQVNREDLLGGEILKSDTAHFGMTLLRTSALKQLKRPWFNRTYSESGELDGDGARDPDVQFWHNWKEAGRTLYTALRVPVGHCALMVRWPDNNLEMTLQDTSDFWDSGMPVNVWR